jgi:hypothetical protein
VGEVLNGGAKFFIIQSVEAGVHSHGGIKFDRGVFLYLQIS